MNRLTEWRNGHGALVRGDGYTKLAEYEDMGFEPEEMKELMGGVAPQRLKELLEAELQGRIAVLPQSQPNTCGSCSHFVRDAGRASGICSCRNVKSGYNRGLPLPVTQSRARCKDDYERKGAEQT